MNRQISIIIFSIMVVLMSIEAQPAAKTNIAVDEFQAQGITVDEASIITNRLRSELIKTDRFTVVERGQMKTILEEQGFQQTGSCASDECMVEVGQLLGVSKMVAGSIGKIGNMFTVNVRVIDVQTGKIVLTVDSDCKCKIEDLVTRTTRDVAAELVKKIAETTEETTLEPGPVEPVEEKPSSEEPEKVQKDKVPESAAEDEETKTDSSVEQKKSGKATYKNGIMAAVKYEFSDTDIYLSLEYVRLFSDYIGVNIGGGMGFIQTESEFFGGVVFNLRPVLFCLNVGYDTYAELLLRTPVLFKIKRSGVLVDVAFEPLSVDVKVGIGGAFFF